MSKSIPLYCLLLATSSTMVSAQRICDSIGVPEVIQVETNAFSVGVGGLDLYWDGDDPASSYPAGAETSPLFAGGIWVSVTDTSGQTLVGAQMYGRSSGSGLFDYQLGVLDPETGLPIDDATYCSLFTVTRAEIDAHRADLADGRLDDELGMVARWPGQGNTLGEPTGYFGHQLAPYVDVDGNGVYSPDGGDYPDIAGDEAVWWTMHLWSIHNQTGGAPVPLEVHGLLQASASADPTVDRTHTLRVTVINQSSETYSDLRVGYWIDGDIGCSRDDAMGSLPDKNAIYFYNLVAVDLPSSRCDNVPTYTGEVPALMLKAISASSDTAPEFGSSIMFSPGYGPRREGGMGQPATGRPAEFINVLSNRWRDGAPYVRSGEGYPPGDTSAGTTIWVFDGEDDGFSMCRNTVQSDVRGILNAHFPGSFRPQERATIDYAVHVIEGLETPCPDRDSLRQVADALDAALGAFVSSVAERPRQEPVPDLRLAPNPTGGVLRVFGDLDALVDDVLLIDVVGRTRRHLRLTGDALDLSDQPAGTYALVFTDRDGRRYARRVVVTR